MSSSELVSISMFRSATDVQTAILDEVGVPSTVRSDNAGGMYPALAGAELLVKTEGAQRATDVLTRRHARESRSI